MRSYYEKFFIQGLVEIPSQFPPPWDFPTFEWGDMEEFEGLYIQDTSTEMMIAAAQGIKARGRFVTAPSVPISDGTNVRRVSDNAFIRIIGEAKQSPKKAKVQIKTFEAELMTRVEANDIAISNSQHGEAL